MFILRDQSGTVVSESTFFKTTDNAKREGDDDDGNDDF